MMAEVHEKAGRQSRRSADRSDGRALVVAGVESARLSVSVILILSFLISIPGARAGTRVHPPRPDSSWPILVFAELDSFRVRYGRFFRSHFDTVAVDRLPTWLEVDADSLSVGERVLARMVVSKDNEEEILRKLLEFVSMDDEIGMTQFSAHPDFPSENLILGHREGSLTLVSYDAMGVRDTLQNLDVVRYLGDRVAFMTDDESSEDLVVLSRGSMAEVDMWYPRLATEVLHTHTIPGNINPTGYEEFFEGSDRDLIVITFRFQDPIRRFLRSSRKEVDPGN
jgi:hypothetical protein